MKRVEEIIPLILKDLEKVLQIKDAKFLVDSDLKKYMRFSRFSLEEVSKQLKELRKSFLETLGYFPDNTAEKIKEISDKVLDTISSLRERETKYYPNPRESFEELKKELSSLAEDLISKVKNL